MVLRDGLRTRVLRLCGGAIFWKERVSGGVVAPLLTPSLMVEALRGLGEPLGLVT